MSLGQGFWMRLRFFTSCGGCWGGREWGGESRSHGVHVEVRLLCGAQAGLS